MLIRLYELKENVAVVLRHEYDPKTLDLEFVDLEYSMPIQLEVTAERILETLNLRIVLVSEVEHTCGICLKKMKEPIHKSFDRYYEIAEKDILDLTEDVREELILDHPISFKCSEGCSNPQASTLATQQGQVNSRPFADLKDLLRKKKEGRSNGTS